MYGTTSTMDSLKERNKNLRAFIREHKKNERGFIGLSILILFLGIITFSTSTAYTTYHTTTIIVEFSLIALVFAVFAAITHYFIKQDQHELQQNEHLLQKSKKYHAAAASAKKPSLPPKPHGKSSKNQMLNKTASKSSTQHNKNI